MTADPRPILFVTNHAPPYRVEPFRRLAAVEDVHFALIGGAARHGAGGTQAASLPFPHATPSERAVYALAAGGRFRAVVAGLSGRVALPSAYAGARRAGVPFVLWATIWAHPRTAAHTLSALPLRRIYRDADAIVTYGPHVSDYVRAKGARAPVFEAPQAVDNAFWSAPADDPAGHRHADTQYLFAGRLEREKGVTVLLDAWRASGVDGALVVAGDGPLRVVAKAAGAIAPGVQDRAQLRNFYAASDVVVLPSLPTRDFREPWGLIVNEAFNQGLPVIASDAVGAAQPPGKGLLRDERNGLVVPARDVTALAGAMRRLHDDRALRDRLGRAGREDVAAYDADAWVRGMRRGLAAVGVSRGERSRPRRSIG